VQRVDPARRKTHFWTTEEMQQRQAALRRANLPVVTPSFDMQYRLFSFKHQKVMLQKIKLFNKLTTWFGSINRNGNYGAPVHMPLKLEHACAPVWQFLSPMGSGRLVDW